MEPDGLLCSCNARSQKVRRTGVRSFLCSRSARPQKGLARRPQSKAPPARAWLADELGEGKRWTRAVGDHLASPQGEDGRAVGAQSIAGERASVGTSVPNT